VKLFGFQISRVNAQAMQAVDSMRGWFRIVGESFAGAFQSAVVVDNQRDLLAFSGLFAPLTLIGKDIAKLRVKLMKEAADGICEEIKSASPFLAVLKKPNRYQTIINFIEQWIISKLLYGNTYILKQRDRRGIVVAMFVLDATRVEPLVAEDGGVYYRLSMDHLAELTESIVVPASEIIHDRWNCLWHPLVGISPIYACGMSATMGNKIQRNSTKFFDNMSRPSGQLTAPGAISTEAAARLKSHFEENFSGANIGRLMVSGDGLKYEPMTIPAEQAQLIEQLKWTVEDVARCFHMPLFMVGGAIPTGTSVAAMLQIYYSACLQSLIESLEASLDEGLALPAGMSTECDLDGLIRMDQAALMTTLAEGVKGSILAPDEARAKLNRKPVPGGSSPMAQQQNYSLAALAKRDASDDPFKSPSKSPAGNAPGEADDSNAPTPVAANDEQIDALFGRMDQKFDGIDKKFEEFMARLPTLAVPDEDDDDEEAVMADAFIDGLRKSDVSKIAARQLTAA